MSGFGDAMSAAIKRRLDKQTPPSDDAKQRQAAEAQKRLGFGKEQPPKAKPETEG